MFNSPLNAIMHHPYRNRQHVVVLKLSVVHTFLPRIFISLDPCAQLKLQGDVIEHAVVHTCAREGASYDNKKHPSEAFRLDNDPFKAYCRDCLCRLQMHAHDSDRLCKYCQGILSRHTVVAITIFCRCVPRDADRLCKQPGGSQWSLAAAR